MGAAPPHRSLTCEVLLRAALLGGTALAQQLPNQTSHELPLYPGGNMRCWSKTFNYETCCNTHLTPTGDPGCWGNGAEFNFNRCCARKNDGCLPPIDDPDYLGGTFNKPINEGLFPVGDKAVLTCRKGFDPYPPTRLGGPVLTCGQGPKFEWMGAVSCIKDKTNHAPPPAPPPPIANFVCTKDNLAQVFCKETRGEFGTSFCTGSGGQGKSLYWLAATKKFLDNLYPGRSLVKDCFKTLGQVDDVTVPELCKNAPTPCCGSGFPTPCSTSPPPAPPPPVTFCAGQSTPIVSNGVWTSPSNIFLGYTIGESTSLTCDAGHVANPIGAELTCGADGVFTGTPTALHASCVVSTTPPPPTSHSPTCAKMVCGHGKCTDAFHSPTCSCDAGWMGVHCERAPSGDQCAGMVCGHGKCTTVFNSATCACDAGWTGAHCDAALGPTPTPPAPPTAPAIEHRVCASLRELTVYSEELTAACCTSNKPCLGGLPTHCGEQCARTVLPMRDDCRGYLDGDIARLSIKKTIEAAAKKCIKGCVADVECECRIEGACLDMAPQPLPTHHGCSRWDGDCHQCQQNRDTTGLFDTNCKFCPATGVCTGKIPKPFCGDGQFIVSWIDHGDTCHGDPNSVGTPPAPPPPPPPPPPLPPPPPPSPSEDIRCSVLAPPINGHWQHSQNARKTSDGRFVLGTIMPMECNEGYTLTQGPGAGPGAAITCDDVMGQGQWIGALNVKCLPAH